MNQDRQNLDALRDILRDLFAKEQRKARYERRSKAMLSRELDRDESWVNLFLIGRIKSITPDMIRAIANFFEVPADYLLEAAGFLVAGTISDEKAQLQAILAKCKGLPDEELALVEEMIDLRILKLQHEARKKKQQIRVVGGGA